LLHTQLINKIMDEEKLSKKEKKALKKEKKALKKLEDQALMESLQIDENKLKDLRKKLAKVESIPERGIETWYRLASKNLYTRRQIVDTKSNILITVNAIMISATLGSLYPLLSSDQHLIYGIVPLTVGNLISIAYAIIATRPNLGGGVFSEAEVQKGNASLMTFDDYYKMPEEEYDKALDEMMQTRTFLYGTIKRDLHHLGVDLSHRYAYIRIAYNVFLIGLVISVIAFGGCHALFQF